MYLLCTDGKDDEKKEKRNRVLLLDQRLSSGAPIFGSDATPRYDFAISDSSSALFLTRPSHGQGREPGLSHPCSVGHGALLLVMMVLDGEMGDSEPPKWGCLGGIGWLGGSSRG